MHLHEYLGWPGPLTHRQFLAWRAFRESAWDRPSRSDQYLMQIAFHVARSNARYPRRMKLDDFRLRFGSGGKPRQTPEESKRKWLTGFASMGVTIREQAATLTPTLEGD